jgi:predicted dehydrogenase
MNQPDAAPLAQTAQPKPLAWGILGAARIARKALIPAIRARGGRVAALGASRMERARELAAEMEIATALEGYQAVIDHPEVEAVYVPLANGDHFHWALACARAGKHCLCEKPIVLRAHEAVELREAFALAGCRLMEAFMWRHHPQVRRVEEWLGAGEIGETRRIHAEFSFLLDRPQDYRWSEAQGGGAFWDIGCYCVNAMRLLFGDEPEVVAGRRAPVEAEASSVDLSTAGWLDFGGDRLGTFACSFSTSFAQSVTITGTRGRIRLHRPYLGAGRPAELELLIGEERVAERFEPHDAYAEMVCHFTRAVRDPSFALLPGEDGVAQTTVMEALVASAAHHGTPQAIIAT